jgi:hypothetical protein
MDCLPFLGGSWAADSLGSQIKRMAEIVRSDSVTRAFLQVSQRGGRTIYLLDRTSRKPLRLADLSQLEIGRLYIFGEGHTLLRSAADTVLLAGTISIPLSVAEGRRCSPPPLRTSRTPEPAVCRHIIFSQQSRTADADDDLAKDDDAHRRRERRAAEARAKRVAGLAATAAAAACSEDDTPSEAARAPPAVLERGSPTSASGWAESLD